MSEIYENFCACVENFYSDKSEEMMYVTFFNILEKQFNSKIGYDFLNISNVT